MQRQHVRPQFTSDDPPPKSKDGDAGDPPRQAAGRPDEVALEVMRLPGRGNAREWIVDARRYVAAREALDRLEVAALLELRMPPQPRAPADPAPAGANVRWPPDFFPD